MDLVDNNELPFLCPQKRICVVQPTLIDGPFQIQVKRRGFRPSRCDGAGEGGLSHLAWSEQHHAWHMFEAVFDERPKASADHEVMTP